MLRLTKLAAEKKRKVETSDEKKTESSSVVNNLLTLCHSQTLFKKSLIPTLLTAGIYSEYEKVDAMLSQDPGLLLEKGTIIDDSGRIHEEKTVYQVVLGACDYNIKHIEKDEIVVRGLVEMVENHFKKLPGKSEAEIDAIMNAQRKAQYPDGHEIKEQERIFKDHEALDDILKILDAFNWKAIRSTETLEDVIFLKMRSRTSHLNEPKISKHASELQRLTSLVIKAPSKKTFDSEFKQFKKYLKKNFIDKHAGYLEDNVFDFNLLKALYQFRNYLEPKEPLKTGKHFNELLLIEAAERCGESSIKNKFFWEKIFGYILRFATSADAKNILRSLWATLHGEEAPQFKSSRKTLEMVIEPMIDDSPKELGFNHTELHTWDHMQKDVDFDAIFKLYFEHKQIPKQLCLSNTDEIVSHKRKMCSIT